MLKLMPFNDPRYYQASVQIILLVWGIVAYQFSIPWIYIVVAFITSLLSQFILTKTYDLSGNYLSAINTTLSILLILRADHWSLIVIALMIAIGSKFFLRFNNRHIFNPSNIAIVITVLLADAAGLLTNSAWSTPGQWGQNLWLALLIAGCGLIFVIGIRQMLTTFSFLACYIFLVYARAIWLGDDWNIPLHQLQNGTLLIFAFFMLSDPKTTPNSDKGRMLYGLWIAILGWFMQFILYIPNAFLYALAISAPLVFILNNLFIGKNYRWPFLSDFQRRNKV